MVEFCIEQWKKNNDLIRGKRIYATVGDQAILFSSGGFVYVPELETNQEEADTRILLHSKHASLECENVIIHSPDTDVFFIAVAKSNDIPANLFFQTGKKIKEDYWI